METAFPATRRTQVGIIGAGPAGLLLSQLLHLQGITSVVLENRSRQRVESRQRAGLLEQNTVNLLREAEAADRLDREGLVHEGVILSYNGRRHRIALSELTDGECVTIYAQTEVVKDLITKRLEAGGELLFEAEATRIEGLETDSPRIHFTYQGHAHILECDFVAGCDGFHGISRAAIPAELQKVYDKTYPYSWLGIIAQVPPSTDELIYAFHERGFALHSMRSAERSRLYVQCGVDDTLEDWPDERIWAELHARLGTSGWTLQEGPILEKSITPMRSFVSEPMQYHRLFLAGDAAHIVPPTGGKGLNMAVADTKSLFDALRAWYQAGDASLLQGYSAACMRRVWRVQEFSNYMTEMLHLLPGKAAFDQHLQQSRFDLLTTCPAASKVIAENYVGIAARRASEAVAEQVPGEIL
ncbi:4-hydroxybenzoate 3-monooxygenase [Hymenobacter jejuensis]|uniref:4-hydroxybenzoate 3-monooxygenase n=1 Tax=Hymenobacter jejuensis TaxID=2502781 RepID=A0A5B8A4U8_9BACT|nr:4-hydroxybenzoate 3-monooxygenase [Hymenobacter jejuensis]QDA62374.1 4-hydroxybenzoate 3-monooxygenase [Hymenobacter jejuensis]